MQTVSATLIVIYIAMLNLNKKKIKFLNQYENANNFKILLKVKKNSEILSGKRGKKRILK